MRRSTIWLGGLALAALGGCGQELRDPCARGGEADARYRVPLVEEYAATSQRARFDERLADKRYKSCAAFDGLRAGQGLDLTIRKVKVSTIEGDSGCFVHLGALPAPASWTFVEDGPIPDLRPTSVAVVSQVMRREQCAGLFYLVVEGSADPFRAPAAGTPPPVLVRRHFQTERVELCPTLVALAPAGGGYLACEDVWVAQLER